MTASPPPKPHEPDHTPLTGTPPAGTSPAETPRAETPRAETPRAELQRADTQRTGPPAADASPGGTRHARTPPADAPLDGRRLARRPSVRMRFAGALLGGRRLAHTRFGGAGAASSADMPSVATPRPPTSPHRRLVTGRRPGVRRPAGRGFVLGAMAGSGFGPPPADRGLPLRTPPGPGLTIRTSGGQGLGARAGRHDRRTTVVARLAGMDWRLLVPAVALCLIGVVLVWSATRPRMAAQGEDPQTYLKKQIANVLVGLAAMTAIALADHSTLRAWTPPAFVLSVLSLAAVLTPLGTTVNGAQSWLAVGGLEVQPSEPAKVTLVLMLAALLGARPGGGSRPRGAQVVLALAAAALPLGLIMLQPDLGTAMIMVGTVGGMLVVAGVRWRWIALLAGAGAAAAVAAWFLGLLRPHQVQRLLTFADPMADPQGAGYNAAQALVTVGSGGLFGHGLFQGGQTGGRFVPEQHTDFVFTVAGEELGFAGAALVLVLLWAVLRRALRIAGQAVTPYGMLAAAGVVCWLSVQTFINVGMVVGLTPIVGVPLPLVSYGGSSVVACLAAVGVLISVRRQARL
ncbi:rod shape-determining protein RodA [Nonomuraea sp. SYSU D8015]|uniref:rod shape-determining protein RodA n=1 Tax=Nonomuraea sp. SYSU D8015 TaxID=2593644 RepID=UPI001CB6E61E|nr:rod shape-determining protein RodA [Nonomuraea sp. SYSU D8015]